MSEPCDLLIEIGTEELPPKALRALSETFAREVRAGLMGRGLEVGERYDVSARRKNDPAERGFWNRTRSVTVRVNAGDE